MVLWLVMQGRENADSTVDKSVQSWTESCAVRIVINSVVDYRYYVTYPRLPFQPQIINAFWQLPDYYIIDNRSTIGLEKIREVVTAAL